jgi:hypothetical protein
MTAPSLATSSPLVSLFHDPAGTAFADLTIESDRETWPIRSQRIRSWLRRCHYQATGEADDGMGSGNIPAFSEDPRVGTRSQTMLTQASAGWAASVDG